MLIDHIAFGLKFMFYLKLFITECSIYFIQQGRRS